MYFWAIKVFKMFNKGDKVKLFTFFICLVFIVPINVFAYTPAEIDINNPDHQARIEEGQKLFKANCAACHKVDQKLTGPALADVWKNWDSQAELVHWVHNSQEVIASGHEHANKIYNEFNKMMMPPFGQLSEEQVVSIMEFYVQAEELGLKPGGGAAAATPSTATSSSDGGASSGSNKWILIAAIGALALMAFALISITSKLEKIVDVKVEEREAAEKAARTKGIGKKLVSILIIFGVVTLGYTVVKGAIDIGHSQGYEPEQPIKFSHALHAGQNKIDCQYCHSGAEKSRHAVIPSVAVCMNCHKYVQEGPKYGKEEIAKIYNYSGWDAEASAFVSEPKSIEWVKIHNLPDHVYFNHSQHVKVGGIECQTCHGKVEEMETVKQFAPLSMGWCINCHRQTDVKFANNDYYSIFQKYHDEIEKGERANVKVKDIGGTECAKCHY